MILDKRIDVIKTRSFNLLIKIVEQVEIPFLKLDYIVL